MIALAYAVCALVWGTTWYAIRVCIGPGGYPTAAAAAIRFTIAGAVLAVVWAAGLGRPGPASRRQLGWLVGAGLLDALAYALVYRAEEDLPGGLVAVIYGTIPLCTAALAWMTGTEKVRARSVGGALLGFAGVALIYWDRARVSSGQALGVAIAFAGVLASTMYSVMVKKHGKGVSPLAQSFIFLATTGVALWFWTAAAWGPLPWPPPFAPTAALLYLAVIGTVVAFALYFYLLDRVPLMTANSLAFVYPVVALAADAILGERIRLDWRAYAGAALTLLGVLTIRGRPDS